MEEDIYHFPGSQTRKQSLSVDGEHWVVVQVISSLFVFTAIAGVVQLVCQHFLIYLFSHISMEDSKRIS